MTQMLSQPETASPSFQVGATVIYGTLGKCQVKGIETREINGESVSFYKLEPIKSTLSRTQRMDPAIWLPVASATKRGLRNPIDAQEAERILEIFSNREYYFPLQEEWAALFPKLEDCIRNEGAIGLAKVYSFLFVLKKKHVVPEPEAIKLDEMVHKLLFRELSEVLKQTPKILTEQTHKLLRKKLLPDN